MRIFIILFFISFSFILYSQQPDFNIDNQFEEAVQNNERNVELNEFDEIIAELKKNPLDLNKATEEDLQNIPFLNDFQIKSIIYYREKYGLFVDIKELKLVYGIDEDLYRLISPLFIINNNEKNTNNYYHNISLRSRAIVEKQQGYLYSDSLWQKNKCYEGNRLKLALKYKLTKNNISAGILAEKDQGEALFRGSNKYGFDYYSGFFKIDNLKFIKTICIGDYQLNIGEGLLIWNGYYQGKSGFVTNNIHISNLIKPYTSFDENAMLRGIATTIKLKPVNISLFISKKSIDANINYNDSTPTSFSSMQTSGLHQNLSAVNDEKSVRENLAGINIEYINKNTRIGCAAIGIYYNLKYIPSDRIYNRLYATGNEFFYSSLYYKTYHKKFIMFGEIAGQNNLSLSLLNGINIVPEERISFGIIYRYYSPYYKSFYANAFAENTTNSNEEGIYLSTKIIAFKHLTFTCYYDIFRFLWLKYEVNAPSDGNEYLINLEYSGLRNINMNLRFKTEIKEKNINSDNNNMVLSEISGITKKQIRFQILYQINENLSFKNRFEWLNLKYTSENENAFMMYQDINYQVPKYQINIKARMAIFDTPGYNSGIYVYENDIRGEYNIIPYYDKGLRYYIYATYAITKNINAGIRFSQTRYQNRIAGTELNSTEKNRMSEIKIIISKNL